jgi:acetyl-CoA carboxylase biotin carboxylase subunit
LVTWGSDRKNAKQRMLRALKEYKIAGVITNIDFLSDILKHRVFDNGTFDINFVEDVFLKNPDKGSDENLDSAAALFSALIKSVGQNKSKRNIPGNQSGWREQLYE